MTLIPCLLDYPLLLAERETDCCSVLCAPLGTSTFLDQLAVWLREVTHEPIRVVPAFATAAAYRQHVHDATTQRCFVVEPRELTAWALRSETSDFALLVDPRQWPVSGDELFRQVPSILEGYRGATHIIALGGAREGAREQIECNEQGQVIRVQRLYSKTNWPEAASGRILLSLIPAKLLAGVNILDLGSLRLELTTKGILSRDWPFSGDVVDLRDESGLLLVHERWFGGIGKQKLPVNYKEYSPGAWCSTDAEIHDSVRMEGQMLIQPGARIDEGVTLIGPTVVAAGCRLGAGATVAQSIVLAETMVPAGAIIRHRVAANDCTKALSPQAIRSMPAALAGVSNTETAWHESDMEYSGVSIRSWHRRAQETIKRGVDICLALLALVILAPLLVLIAVLIKLDSRGPIFFVHHREGKGGTEFPCLKFRTMISGAHSLQRELYRKNEVDGPQFKVQKDPRITRLGRLLRATNIDELPQMVNVLLGHMSLVGPRPSPFRENQICVPWRRARLSVRPGITGLWQLCRADDRSRGDFHEWIRFDILYVRHYSLWLDLKILLGTAVTVGGRWRVPLSWFIRSTNSPTPGTTAIPIGSIS